MSYLKVAEDENSEPMELPTEEDGTIMLSTIAAQFPSCCGLKYRNAESKAIRGVRLTDDRLHPPTEGWGDNLYICSFQNKRKSDDNDETKPTKMKRLEEKLSGSDLIVLGVSYSTTDETIRNYFEKFGSLKVVQVKRDFNTGLSKGFAFIRYSSLESQLKVLKERHYIDGRWCSVRIPSSKESTVGELTPTSKLFIGRVSQNLSTKDLEEYFSQFGQVVDVYIPKPHRSFGFVTFHDSDIAQKLCGEDHIIKGVSVSVSNATPKHNKQMNHGPQQQNSSYEPPNRYNSAPHQQFGYNNYFPGNNYMAGPAQSGNNNTNNDFHNNYVWDSYDNNPRRNSSFNDADSYGNYQNPSKLRYRP